MRQAATVYLITRFAWGLLFWLMATVYMIYQIETVGLDPLQLVLVGTALELSAFLFEVPTGVVADTWSRKGSVVIGYVLTGVSFLLAGLAPEFLWLVVASFIWGIGWTFISGAHPAWLADEVGEAEAATLYLRGEKVHYAGAFAGILLAVLIGQQAVHLPIVLSGAGFLLTALLLWVYMPESVQAQGEGGLGAGPLETFKAGARVIRGSSTLILLMIVGVVFGTFSEGYDRLSTAHLLQGFAFESATGMNAVLAIGIMTALGILLSLVVVSVAENRLDVQNPQTLGRALSMVTAGIVLAALSFALAGQVWIAIGLYVLLAPLRSLIDPLTMAWVNRNLPSSSRATVISMHSQADALGQIAGGPGVGMIGREFSIRIAIVTAAMLLVPALWLYARARTLSRKRT